MADGQELPADWDVKAGRNVRWKADVPGVGHSSPIVWGERVFVTTAVPAEEPRLVLGDKGGIELASDKPPISWRLLCFDAKDGKRLWEREAFAGAPRAARHVKSSQANPTPVTDGKTVVALFGSGTLAAYDVDGAPRWSVELGKLDPGLLDDPSSEWGHGSSPVIFENLAIVQVDKHKGSFLAAFELATGKPAWRVERDERPVWATPTLDTSGGRPELYVVGGYHVRGYDPRTGKELWRFKDVSEVKTPTPFASDGLVIFAGGYRGRPLFAIKAGAQGDVSVAGDVKSGPFLAWRTDPGGPYTTTPLAYRDLSTPFATRASCSSTSSRPARSSTASAPARRTAPRRSRATARSTWRARTASCWSCVPAAASSYSHASTWARPSSATPAIARGTLYVRTRGHLYAISAAGRATADR